MLLSFDVDKKMVQPEKKVLTRGHKKKARTRQQLLDAALRIYARNGTSELALNELAREAGVSSGTIYNYFRTRGEVLEAVGIALAVQLSHQVANISTDVTKGAERTAIGIRTFIRKAIRDSQWAAALVSVVRYAEGMRSALATYVRADLQTGLTQGELSYADEDVAMTFVVAAVTGAMAAIVEGQVVEQHDSLVAEMVLLGLGMTPTKARKIAFKPMPRSIADASE